MAFRLTPGRTTSKQLARIVRKEATRAADQMRATRQEADAVYDARKRVKKIRAILHLLRGSMGHTYRTFNRRLRTVARQLSGPRDADAALETLRMVHIHYPRLITRAMFDAARRGLTPKQRRAASRLRPAPLQRELRRVAKTLPRQIRRAASSGAIQAGIEQGYARACQAMRELKTTPEDTAFHTWRRRVKDHWYQLRLLEATHLSLRPRVRRLKRLEQWLGDDHNLVLLRTAVLAAPSSFGDERQTAILLGCMEKYHATLRKRALRLGERLFHAKPHAFAKPFSERRHRR